jgi:hypothetical protein
MTRWVSFFVLFAACDSDPPSARDGGPLFGRDGAIARDAASGDGGGGGEPDAGAPPRVFDFYIAPDGSDDAPGTREEPWAITAINGKRELYAGRTVGLLDGTYPVGAIVRTLGLDFDVPALDIEGGSEGAPTVIAAVNARRAILDAKDGEVYGNPENGAPILGQSPFVTEGNVVIDGLVVRGGFRSVVHFGPGGRLGPPRVSNVTVQNCEFTDINAFGAPTGVNLSVIRLHGIDGASISNNYFHECYGHAPRDGDHFSAVLTWGTAHSTFTYNTIIDCGGIYAKEANQFGNEIAYNFVDLTGWGSTIGIQDFAGPPGAGDTDRSIVHHNVVVSALPIDLRGTLGESWTTEAHVYSNTMVAPDGEPFEPAAFATASGAGLLRFYDNLIAGDGVGWRGFVAIDRSAAMHMDYNVYPASNAKWTTFADGSAGGGEISDYTTLEAWGAAVGGESHSLSSDHAHFVGTGERAERFRLADGSPARAAGTVDGSPTGAATDIGAWGHGATRIGCDF